MAKTTLDLPDELVRRANTEAGLRGCKLEDLVEEGLRRVLRMSQQKYSGASLEQLMSPARGVVDSGVADLGSNAKHFKPVKPDAAR